MQTPRPETASGEARGSTEALIRSEVQVAGSPELRAVIAPVLERFGDAVSSILFYGSVRRGVVDVEGLLDLVVVVKDYRSAYEGWKLRGLNALLPPNVFYLETEFEERTLRAKYAVVSLAQLERATQPRCLQVWFWGRLAQPVVLAHAADDAAAASIHRVLTNAVHTFMTRAAPLLDAPFSGEELWERGLAACYSTEFRAERRNRATKLVEHDTDRYRRITQAAALELGWTRQTRETDGQEVYAPPPAFASRTRARWAWFTRRLQGKTLHVARLIKATQTFDGGMDYIVWKIERHSGVKVEVSERARRHPVLAGWLTLWRLRRKGGFR